MKGNVSIVCTSIYIVLLYTWLLQSIWQSFTSYVESEAYHGCNTLLHGFVNSSQAEQRWFDLTAHFLVLDASSEVFPGEASYPLVCLISMLMSFPRSSLRRAWIALPSPAVSGSTTMWTVPVIVKRCNIPSLPSTNGRNIGESHCQ